MAPQFCWSTWGFNAAGHFRANGWALPRFIPSCGKSPVCTAFLLFSPERAASAQGAALAFAVVLLPYSLIGPVVGTLLDKFSRRQILFYANNLRAFVLLLVAGILLLGNTGVLLTLTVLISFGVNRLILAGLSAATPRLVSSDRLITANALSVTGGTIAIVLDRKSTRLNSSHRT